LGVFTDLSDDKYLEYIDAIENYLKSKEVYKFSAENFANTIVQVINLQMNFVGCFSKTFWVF
jgi:hypothetical protein